MSKIGILTFHWADNFGAVLQTYALQETLKQLGADVSVINFIPSCLHIDYQLFPNPAILTKVRGAERLILTYASRIRRFNQIKKRINSYANFRKNYLNLSGDACKSVEMLDKVCNNFDICIVGSDQVWNPNFLSLCDNAYLLPFNLSVAKKASYAASISCCLNARWAEIFSKHLKSFLCISVREETSCVELSRIINRQVHHVLDPSLLVSTENYKKITKPKKDIEGKRYLLVYNYTTHPLPVAERIAEQLNIPMIVFNKPRKYRLRNFYCEFSDAGPEESLYLIENADYIVTDSYHATIFSIIFEKSFITIPHPTRAIRMIELLRHLGVEDRIVRDVGDLNIKLINIGSNRYNINKEILKEKQHTSINFLKDIINL